MPHAHITTTTTHKSLRGPRGGMVLAQEEFAADVDRGCPMVLGGPLSHVMAAKAVALDPNGAWDPSGVRLGTPALPTRGFGHDEFDTVAELIVDVLRNTQPGTTKAGEPSKASYVLGDGVADRVKARSAEMLDKHPLYPGLVLS